MRRAAGAVDAKAVARTARQATEVYNAVINGPKHPAPAGCGVKLVEFRKVLPWMRWKDLATFANHFGKRGSAVGEIAGALAVEAGRRLEASPSSSSSATQRHTKSAELSGEAARCVSGMVYSFSKLRPQLPQYAAIYHAAASAVLQGNLKPNRFQAALMGVAFADAEEHQADVIPVVLRPVLQELRQKAVMENVTTDELRYLLHACARLPPSAALESEDVQALARYTCRLAPSADFASAAHLFVSWLRLEPPAAAKQAHFEALRAASRPLRELEPGNPAHPLPAGGLAPALSGLLAREEDWAQPPLTPPLLREVVEALVQISRGLRADHLRGQGTLGLADLVETARLATGFCEAHQRLDVADSTNWSSSQRKLPRWAASVLGYVAFKASVERGPADLVALRGLLRLLRSYSAFPAPDERFYTWASEQLMRHGADADPATVAEAVEDLVPHLPEGQRGQLMEVVSKARDGSGRVAATRRPVALPQVRLLTGVSLFPEPRRMPANVKLAGAKQPAAAAAVPAAATSVAAPEHARVWSMISEPGATAAASSRSLFGALDGARTAAVRVKALDEARTAAVQVKAEAEAAAGAKEALSPALDESQAELSVAHQAAKSTPADAAQLQASDAGVQKLVTQLEGALKRIDVLEARLQEQSEKPVLASSADRPEDELDNNRSGPMQASMLPVESEMPQLPQFDMWPQPAAMLRARASMPGLASGTPLYRSSFNFEQFRRAESAKVQETRLRVVCPPDYFPLFLSKK